MRIKPVLVTLVATIALSGCIGTVGFGGAGNSLEAGERLARQVCQDAIRQQGQQVVDLYRTSAVDYPYRGAGLDLYFTTRGDAGVWCRFMYDTGSVRLLSA